MESRLEVILKRWNLKFVEDLNSIRIFFFFFFENGNKKMWLIRGNRILLEIYPFVNLSDIFQREEKYHFPSKL